MKSRNYEAALKMHLGKIYARRFFLHGKNSWPSLYLDTLQVESIVDCILSLCRSHESVYQDFHKVNVHEISLDFKDGRKTYLFLLKMTMH